MACRCNTLICCRCVALRYPDKKFNIKVKQQTCPRCEDYCNCTLCCQKRGVPYISSTRGYQAQQHAAPKAKRLPTVLLSAVPPPNAQYWGAIYSLDGQKMGATFAAPAGDALPSVAFAGSIAQRRPAEKLKRTFVGSLQRSWGFGRDRLIKELNPVRQMKSKSRPRKNDRLVTRSFVGSASFLRYRPRFLTPDPLDEEDLLAGLSPLTSLSSDSEDEHDKIKIGISILAPPEGTELTAFSPLQLNGN
ncbi:hypothetical protein BJ912DRAFT_608039 [Pholiota molesta]|nr:hypothetical protein BJ912DRAFT_608039 [Pholiota molesta]